MSFLTDESLKSPENGGSSRISPFVEKNHDSIKKSSLTEPSKDDSDAKCKQNSENKTKTKREVYKFEIDSLVSSIAWSYDVSESFELAIGTFAEEYCTQINIVHLAKDSYDEEIQLNTAFEHPYPPTKISWIPRTSDSAACLPRLLATSADYLRIWRIPRHESTTTTTTSSTKQQNENFNNNETDCDLTTTRPGEKATLACSLSPGERGNYFAPLTSFDWNEIDSRIIVTSSVDTTCAVWDLETGVQVSSVHQLNDTTSPSKVSGRLKNQILAHDHEVYDVSFSRQGSGHDVFVTAGGDGSLRLFDLRMLSTSTVLYETSDISNNTNNGRAAGPALIRVACNKQDPNYVATFSTDSKDVVLIDVRKIDKPMVILSSHGDNLNGISWAPHSAHHLCSASDDSQALIWGLTKLPEPVDEPLLAYRAGGKINAINWSSVHPDWIAIGFENCLELLRV